MAILSGSRGNRPHCIYRGFCIQGCKVGAKASTLITHVPDALDNGAEIRDRCMVSRIHHDKKTNRVTGVSYFDAEGSEHFQKAKAVIVSGYAIETPRLLLNSACDGYENGLANSSDTVGRYLMAQAGNVILGRFDEPVRMYKAPPAHALTEEFYETDPKRDFARGFAIQTVGPLPIAFAKQMMAARGSWGWGMRRIMMDYNHWSAFGLLGEILPWPDNRVTLAEEKDQFGLRVAHVNFDLHDNDKKLIEFGKNKVEEVMRAAGAEEVVQEARYAHLVGAARMGKDPATSVVDGFGRTHDIANLFVCDGSILPTQGSANPGLTIQALAARTADYLISQGTRSLQLRPARHDAAAGAARAFPARHSWRRRAPPGLTIMAKNIIGRKTWAIAEGYIPGWSHGPEPEFLSHEAFCILNTTDEEAHIELTIYYADREPAGPYRMTVAARRTHHFRFNNLTDPEPIPRGYQLRQRLRVRRAGRDSAYAAGFAPGGECFDDHHCLPGAGMNNPGIPFIPYPPIARHGVIGDRRTGALVAADGTLDWFCAPEFDGEPVFGALLDAAKRRVLPFGTGIPGAGAAALSTRDGGVAHHVAGNCDRGEYRTGGCDGLSRRGQG